jgi:hypothetical protein
MMGRRNGRHPTTLDCRIPAKADHLDPSKFDAPFEDALKDMIRM